MNSEMQAYPARGWKCPGCGQPMAPMMASGGWAPEGFTPEYDHWWCGDCLEVVLFDEEGDA